MLKTWFPLAAVSSGIGFGSTLIITQNLEKSGIAGLASIPAVLSSMLISQRRRKQEIDRFDRDVLTHQSQLETLKQQQLALTEELDFKKLEQLAMAQKIEQLKILSEDLNRNLEQQANIESKIASSIEQCQHQKNLLVAATNRSTEKQEQIDRLDQDLIDRQEKIATCDRAIVDLEHKRESLNYIHLELDRVAVVKTELETTMVELETKKSDLQAQVERLNRSVQDCETALAEIENQRQIEIAATQEKQIDLNRLNAEIIKGLANKERLDVEISSLTSKQRQLESDLGLKENHFDRAIDRFVHTQEQQQQTLSQLDELHRSQQQKQQQMEGISADLVHLEHRHQMTIAATQDREINLNRLNGEIAKLSAAKERLVLDLGCLEIHQEQLKSELDDREQYLTTIVDNITKLQEEQQRIAAINSADWQNRIVTEEAKAREIANRIATSIEREQRIKTEITQLESILSDRQVRIQKGDRELTKLQHQRQIVDEELSAYMATKENLEIEIVGLKNRRQSLQNQIITQKQELSLPEPSQPLNPEEIPTGMGGLKPKPIKR
jgi:chromosome segregation ATPase